MYPTNSHFAHLDKACEVGKSYLYCKYRYIYIYMYNKIYLYNKQITNEPTKQASKQASKQPRIKTQTSKQPNTQIDHMKKRVNKTGWGVVGSTPPRADICARRDPPCQGSGIDIAHASICGLADIFRVDIGLALAGRQSGGAGGEASCPAPGPAPTIFPKTLEAY